MTEHRRRILNCLVVAGLTASGVFLFLQLPQEFLLPLRWVSDMFGTAAAKIFYFVYGFLLWAVFAVAVGWLMRYLKPASVVMYGLVSLASFLAVMQPWTIHGPYQFYGVIRDLLMAMLIPVVYFWFASRSKSHEQETQAASTK